MSIRTDLAREIKDDLGYLPEGVTHERTDYKGFEISRINICSEAGAYAMKKPMGRYISLDTSLPIARLLPRERTRLAKKGARELASLIDRISGDVLIIGLGNRMITADSLGPKVCGNVFVSRHILSHIPEVIDDRTNSICAIAPGVLGVTGLESFEVVRGITEKIKPSLVIAIDALAARNTDRLGASIQITDTGISPGAGLNNHRESLTRQSLGIPVIAIGVPTVVYTGTIISDTLDRVMQEKDRSLKHQIIRDVSSSSHSELVVTPKDIDQLTDYSARLIAEMLDYALNPYLSRTEIEEYRS